MTVVAAVTQIVADGVIILVTVPAPEYERVMDEAELSQVLAETSLDTSEES